MAKPKLNLSLEPSIAELLRKTGSPSGYVERIVEERWREWTEALEVLREGEWAGREILAAADALNGLWLPRSTAAQVSLALLDAQAAGDLVGKWKIDEQRYRGHVGDIRDSEQLAWAVATIAREVWADNKACKSRVRAMEKQ